MKYAEFTHFPSRFAKIVSWNEKDRLYRATWRLFDAAFVFSLETSGRARAQMHGYTVYQFAIQSSRSLECSLKLFHPNLVFTNFAQFRECVYAVCVCVRARAHTHIYIYPFPISLFRKSPFIHLARKCGCRATEIRRLRGLVCGEM